MVTRRYYRSGDSEFYINKQSARLRDIHELFMDTGLGREGYSNVSQGRIDEILAVKSTDRREIFEEAAGISKYRHRKEETERKLLTTEDNLLRIGDKVSELELQLEPLKAQSEKARNYLASSGDWRLQSGWRTWTKLRLPPKRRRRITPRPPSCWSRSTWRWTACTGRRRS